MPTSAATIDIPTDLLVFDHESVLRRCQEAGLSYTDLGSYCGKGYHAVRSYLLGTTDPPATMVGVLAYILNVHPGDLYRHATEDDVDANLVIRARTPVVQVASRPGRRALLAANPPRTRQRGPEAPPTLISQQTPGHHSRQKHPKERKPQVATVPEDFPQYPSSSGEDYLRAAVDMVFRVLDAEDPEAELELPAGFPLLSATDWFEVHMNRPGGVVERRIRDPAHGGQGLGGGRAAAPMTEKAAVAAQSEEIHMTRSQRTQADPSANGAGPGEGPGFDGILDELFGHRRRVRPRCRWRHGRSITPRPGRHRVARAPATAGYGSGAALAGWAGEGGERLHRCGLGEHRHTA